MSSKTFPAALKPLWPAGLALSLLLCAGAAQAAQVDYFLKIDGVAGESESTAQAAGFHLAPYGDEARVALLLPAVQSAREAARRIDFAKLACDGTVVPELEMHLRSRGQGDGLIVKFKDLLVSSWSLQGGDGVGVLRGGAGNDTLLGQRGNDGATAGQDGNDLLIVNNGDGSDFLLAEHVLLTYTGLEFIDPATGEAQVFDCTRGPCECAGD